MYRNCLYPLLFFLILGGGCDLSLKVQKDVLLAQKSFKEERYIDAIGQYKEILNKNPPSKIKEKIYYRLSEMYVLYLNDFARGIMYLEKLQKETDDPGWLVKTEENIGEIRYQYMKDYYGAIKNYKKLTEFLPKLEKSDLYQYRLAKSYLEAGKYQDAIKNFEIITNNPYNSYLLDASYGIGDAYYREGKWNECVKYWSEYLKKEQNVEKIAETKFLIANIKESQEDFDVALAMYYSILGEYPNIDIVKNRIKRLYLRKSRKKQK